MVETRDRKVYQKIYRELHKDKIKEYEKRYRETHREERRKATEKWRKNNLDHKAEYERNYRKNHLEQSRNAEQKYRESHKEKIRNNARKRYLEKSEKNGVKRFKTNEDILKIYYDNLNEDWEQLAKKLGLTITTTKIRIGLALMKECRENPSCPMTPLLPEYGEDKK